MPPPNQDNDYFAQPEVFVELPGLMSSTTEGATFDPGEPTSSAAAEFLASGPAIVAHSIWWRILNPGAGRLTVLVDGAQDPVPHHLVAVYSGPPGAGLDDDGIPIPSTATFADLHEVASQLQPPSQAIVVSTNGAHDYWVQVEDWGLKKTSPQIATVEVTFEAGVPGTQPPQLIG